MLEGFGSILLFIIAAILLCSLILGISKWLRPHKPNEEKLSTYESGEEPVGNAGIQFNARFYVVAILFVLFEAELLFMFPWSVVFGNAEINKATNGLWGWFALAEMAVFVVILAIGLVYAWGKGYLEWVRPSPKIPTTDSPVPPSLYENISQKYRPTSPSDVSRKSPDYPVKK